MIDLRSDFCAPPTDEMWEAMRAAELGWASAGDDENVNELERRGAELLGKEAAVFVPTCTMANLAALLAQGIAGPVGRRRALGPRDDERVARHLGAGGPRAVPRRRRPRPARSRRRRARVPPLGRGAALPREHAHARRRHRHRRRANRGARGRGAQHGARVHLDGARLPNAAVALGVPLAALAAPVDTVALSLNKGLCAPFGALLAGDAATIDAARAPRPPPRRRDDAQGGHPRRRRPRRARPRRPPRRGSPPRARRSPRRLGARGAGDEHRPHGAPGSRRCSSSRPAACSPSTPGRVAHPPRHSSRRSTTTTSPARPRRCCRSAGRPADSGRRGRRALRRRPAQAHDAPRGGAHRDHAGRGERELRAALRGQPAAEQAAERRAAEEREEVEAAARPRRCSGASSWIARARSCPRACT